MAGGLFTRQGLLLLLLCREQADAGAIISPAPRELDAWDPALRMALAAVIHLLQLLLLPRLIGLCPLLLFATTLA